MPLTQSSRHSSHTHLSSSPFTQHRSPQIHSSSALSYTRSISRHLPASLRMPFDQEPHKIFDARLATFLAVNIARYVDVLERFLATRIKAGKPFKFEEDMFSKLGSCVEEQEAQIEAHHLELVLFGGEQDDLLKGFDIVLRVDSLPEEADDYIKVHEIDPSSVPNVVDWGLPSASSWSANGRKVGKRRARGGITATRGQVIRRTMRHFASERNPTGPYEAIFYARAGSGLAEMRKRRGGEEEHTIWEHAVPSFRRARRIVILGEDGLACDKISVAYLLCQGDADIVYVYDRGDGIAREECLTHAQLVAQLQVRGGEGDVVKGELVRALERGAARRRPIAMRLTDTPNANRYTREGGR